jgi:hypothetical protein
MVQLIVPLTHEIFGVERVDGGAVEAHHNRMVTPNQWASKSSSRQSAIAEQVVMSTPFDLFSFLERGSVFKYRSSIIFVLLNIQKYIILLMKCTPADG